MEFELTRSEKRVLGLPIEQAVPYKEEKPRKHGGRGTSKENKTSAYNDIQNKVDKGFSNIAGYSQYLHKMDGSKYAAAIVEAYANSEHYSTILTNVLRTDKIPADKKLELATTLLDISSDHILSTMKDDLQKKAIAAPLQGLKEDLALIVAANRKNARVISDNALMEKRSMHISRIIDLRPELYVYTVACKVCTQTRRGSALDEALLGIKHEQECPYATDKQRVYEQRNRYPKDTRPLRSIFDHYIINLPLKRITEGEEKNAVERHLHFMPDDYKLYVLTENKEEKG